MTRQLFGILAPTLALLTLTCAAQDTHPVSGRKIAPVMGIGGADWLVRNERVEEEHPDEALDLIGIPKGGLIGDVGAGVGYYSAKLAQRVGPEGKIYANDIQIQMLERLRKNMSEQNITNVIPILGADDDPRLPKAQLDLVLLVDVYHEFSRPVAMIDHIRDSLKPGGRLVLLEYRAEDPDVPIRPEHKMSVKTVRKELEPQALKFQKSIEKLPWQHIIIFTR
jgi:ubiquinone/menaquinone biosynthesis C-methylase UbiE